jgi:DNA-binding CsgD family transcriptional regulator
MRRGRPPYPGLLTPREQEVLALLQEGLTNEEIADRLGITERGARYHVSEILSKLGVQSRFQAAAWQPAASGSRFFGVALLAMLWRKLPLEQVMKLTTGAVLGAAVVAAIFIAIGIAVMDSRSGGEDDSAAINGAEEQFRQTPVQDQAASDGPMREIFGWGEHLQYEVPGMDAVKVRQDITYKTVDGFDLDLDLYLPPDVGEDERLPVVVIVPTGNRANPQVEAGEDRYTLIKSDFKSADRHAAYGRMLAASGLAAVVFNERYDGKFTQSAKLPDMQAVVGDVNDLFSFVQTNADSLNVDASRICVWDLYAPYGVIGALSLPRQSLSCLVVYYGPFDLRGFVTSVDDSDLEAFSPILALAESWPATFVVKADAPVPIDDFIARSRDLNVDLEVMEAPRTYFDLNCGERGGERGGPGYCDDPTATASIVQAAINFVIDHFED